MDFDVDGLLEEAKSAAQLSDWGEAQGWGLSTFRRALEIQVHSIVNDRVLSDEARTKIRSKLIRLLSNRLMLVEDRKRYEDISEQKIERPIIVLGLARTGSTLIHGLLAEDPDALVPRYWECELPSTPPPGLAGRDDPRIAIVSAELEKMIEESPLVAAQHPYYKTQGVHVQAECGHLLEMTFASVFNWAYFGADQSYEDLLFDHDYARTCMDFHRKCLQHLQVGRPASGRWVLKAPEHMKHLRALIEQYPDACIIWTHRPVVQTIASNASVTGIVRAVNRPMDRKGSAQSCVRFLRRWMDEALVARELLGPEQYFDLHYQDLMRDPTGTVAAIYEHFDLPFTEEHPARMLAYLDQNPHSAAGDHKYSLEELGLSGDVIADTFKDYRDAVGLSLS